MPELFDTLIRGATLLDGSGAEARLADVALRAGRIARIAMLEDGADGIDPGSAAHVVQGQGLVLAPGFIDVHTHDDTNVVRQPEMTPKLSQGVTTVIVGNCGISAAPVALRGEPPDPMNLLGTADAFRYPDFGAYAQAVQAAQPAVNVAALVGHTALRSNHMDRLDRTATEAEITAMRAQLEEALDHGALGLSTGLAYANAFSATTGEVLALAEPLARAGALYATHLRSEFAEILEAMDEAFRIGRHARVPVVISHLKCAGVDNWGRSAEVLDTLERAQRWQPVGCDCYPYTASSSTLDLKQVTSDFDIMVTWSEPHPDMGGRLLADIAAEWELSLEDAARRLQPAGAVYHCMEDADVDRILSHPATVVGSDGLPNDPLPHPRLWGAFPRVLGHYARDRELFPLTVAIHKMTGLSAERFGLTERGFVREGYWADLVLFDAATIRDAASFTDPMQPAEGIAAVWVNGELSWQQRRPTGTRAGRFLARGKPAGANAATPQ
ncbi:N-acyl-D-amino-acid deacylase family protein [Cupriavidus basilensis]|uniref:N-acyl-D-amino-acid deacylase family protein n=1 Tax=Cupriavidus TaxID=106589 RepID=UPI00045280CB|nr:MULTISPECIES: D-aminoacylase [Cupriavidus]KDP88571.1 D-aminoacylase [Cupriavidus sp. SK-3]MDF3886011.1 D-aminoacylase [Cupriavidus basilensis]